VVIYPNCVIAGDTTIGENCVISAGTVLIDKRIPDNSLVFGGSSISIKENKSNLIADYFAV